MNVTFIPKSARAKARGEVLAHIIVGNIKVATISAGALAPAKGAQCCAAVLHRQNCPAWTRTRNLASKGQCDTISPPGNDLQTHTAPLAFFFILKYH